MASFYDELTNTEFERLALAGVNLSDGHARLPLDAPQRFIVSALPEIFEEASSGEPLELEQRFLATFFSALGQSSALSLNTFLSYSASSALSIASRVTSGCSDTVGLIEPVFDNIRHFLEGESLRLLPLLEASLGHPDEWPDLGDQAAVWIVSPNNPTGFELDRETFAKVASACERLGYLLVVDATFRPHSACARAWDMYSVLFESGVEFIVVEDTGKTWSLHDMKVGITVCSDGAVSAVHKLHDQLLLNVSSVALGLLTRIIADFVKRGYDKTIGHKLAVNRKLVHDLCEHAGLEHVGRCEVVPLELLRLPVGTDTSAFWHACTLRGVHVLPAHNYYWSSPKPIDLFRIPLSRPVVEIERACRVMDAALEHRIR